MVDVDSGIHQRPVVRDRVLPFMVTGLIIVNPIYQNEIIAAPGFIDVILVTANKTDLIVEQVKRSKIGIHSNRLFNNVFGLLLHLVQTFLQCLILFGACF
ncbi:MAG: hypothetical protein DME65_12270 [Verrucomicrobia bacterium]|nr:MAG: hypothetical protein DME65_12270 [Verrucomicrobiota bacterium]